MTKSARETALDVLQACRKDGAWADGALKKAIAQGRLDSRDAAFCTRLVYGVLQEKYRLDFYLSHLSRGKAEPLVQDLLELGAYQLLCMDKVPASAAVNETVELCKKRGRAKAAPMVNAVLRRLEREKQQLPAIPRHDTAAYLSIRYSHPLWLVEEFLRLLPPEEAEALLETNNRGAPLTVQVNSLKTSSQALGEELRQQGIQAQPHPWMEGCWIVQGAGNLEQLPAFQEGRLMVQDAGAKLAALVCGARPGDRVMDLCAAPGGKSFALAMEMQNRGSILSCDIHGHKLRLLEAGARRLGIDCMETALADGRIFQEKWQESADVVLCDVPCSGLGIIRKKPDIRYKDPAQLAGLPAIQGAILENAARYLKPGGTLVYATCTLLPRENQEVTQAFLAENPAFRKEAFSVCGKSFPGDWTLWPQRSGTDGFYICKLRKTP